MKDRNDWHLIGSDRVIESLESDRYKGLAYKEAMRRKRTFGTNCVWGVKRVGTSDIARATVFDLATLLLAISAGAAAMFDMDYEAIAMIVLLIVGGLFRAIVFVKANHIFEDAANEKIPVTAVIREGKVLHVSASETVLGDLIFIEAGESIPCDGRVISDGDAVVSERGITENRAPVHKFDTIIKTESKSGEVPVEYRSNMVFAGSVVLSGKIRMISTAIGEDTLIVRKQGRIEIESSDNIPTIEKLSAQSRTVSLVMLAFVMGITFLSLFVGDGFTLPRVFLGTMAMAVAAMSEFLTAIGYIIVAVMVRNAASGGKTSKNAEKSAGKVLFESECHPKIMIRNPGSIDDISVIKRIVFMGTSYFKSGRAQLCSYRINGQFEHDMKGKSPSELLALAVAAASDCRTGLSSGNGEDSVYVSEEAKFVSSAVAAYSRKFEDKLPSYLPISHISSENPLSSGMDISLITRDDEIFAVACGPIDIVLRCCTSQDVDGMAVPLDENSIREIFTECAKLEIGGAKVVAVSSKPSQYRTLNRISAITSGMTFVGFFALSEEPENGARENVKFIRENGISPILFTLRPKEDLYYCHRIGMFNKRTKVLRFSELTEDFDENASDGVIVSFEGIEESSLGKAYCEAMNKLCENKTTAVSVRKAVRAAFFEKADVCFAVARNAFKPVHEPISRRASAVVYPDAADEFGGFAGIVWALRLARRAQRNIESAKYYLTASQSARLVLIIASVIFGMPMLSSVFILIWGLIFDFFAVLSMAFENEDDCDSLPRNNVGAILLGGVLGGLLTAFLPFAQWIAHLLDFTLNDGILISLLSASVIIMGLTLSFESMKRCSFFRAKKINLLYFVAVCVSIIFALTIMFTKSGAYLVGGEICSLLGILAPIPTLAVILIFEIARIVSGRLSGKKQQIK